MTSIEMKRLARRIAKIEREQANQGKPQLAYSSIENGNVKSYEGGDLKMIVGMQDDGGQTTQVFNGPTPPTPVGFTVDVDHGKFIVHWSGDFDGDALAPSDWSRAEVHASQDPYFVPSRATARGSIVSAAGGEVTIGVLKGPWTIKMLAWSQAGKMSAPSAPVDVEVPGYGDIVLEEIDAATTLIKNAGEMLLEGQQTLADKLAGIADLDPEEISQEIAQARQEAIDAALAEIANVEGTLTSAIGGKSSTTWSTSNPPAQYDGAVGDTWVKLTSLGSGGREIRRSRWQGDVWVDHPVDGAVLSNVDASTITAGFLDVVNRIRANAILADKLLIGGDRNWIANGDLSKGNAVGWPASGTYRESEGPPDGGSAPNVVWPERTRRVDFDWGPYPVTGGEKIAFEAWVNGSPPGSETFIEVRYEDSQGALQRMLNWSGQHAHSQGPMLARTSEWTKVVSTATVPDDARSLRVTYFDFNRGAGATQAAAPSLAGVKLYSQVGGTLIEPGGIQTPHLAADVLEVGNLKAGTAALAEAVIKKLFAEVVVARMAQAEEFIGENALLTGAVTAPKITASEELWAKLAQFVNVRAEMIDSDAFRGRVFTGNTYLTSDGNGEFSDRGLFFRKPDGTAIFRVPTDGTPISMSAADTQIQRAQVDELEMTEGSIRSGGTLTLSAGVTPPASPPELNSAWRKVASFPTPEERADVNGLAKWGDKWVRAVNVLGTGEGDRIEIYNQDGTLSTSWPIKLDPQHGVTVIGDVAYVLGKDHDRPQSEIYCFGYNLNTGTRVARSRFNTTAQSKIAITSDSNGNLVTAQKDLVTPELIIYARNPSTGLVIPGELGGRAPWEIKTLHDLQGIHVSGNTVYIAHRDGTRGYSYNNGTFTLLDGENAVGWGSPNRDCAGMVWNGDTPFIVENTGALYAGSEFVSDTTMQACYTWWDGQHETTPSDTATVNVGARETATASMPTRPGLQKRVYLRQGTSGAWTRTTLGENTTSYVETSNAAGLYQLPTMNTFPNSDPSTIRSGNGGFQVRGDGSGHWGPLTVDATGGMTIKGMAAGANVEIVVPSGSSASKTITFPEGRFTEPPSVTLACDTWAGSVTGYSVYGVTKDSFVLTVARTNNSPTRMNWIAMEVN